VHGWTDVGRSVEKVNHRYDPGEDVVMFETVRPQRMTAWINKESREGNDRSDDKELHHLPENDPVISEQIDDHNYRNDMPRQIWNHKKFAERYQIIHEHMDRVILSADVDPLNDHIREKIQWQKPQILIVIISFTVIHVHSSSG
jgi:hypothetical protein